MAIDATVAEATELPRPGGFWRRIGAMFIDMLVLGFVCFCIRLAIGDRVYELGDWGRSIGLVVGVAYFGAMHSRWFHGQTFGKAFLGLRVVRRDGGLLTLQHALLRAAIYLIPAALNGLVFESAVYSGSDLPVWLAWSFDIVVGLVLFVIVFGGIFSGAVLFLSDPNWRRALHDYLARTVVVREGGEGIPPAPPFTRVKLGLAVAAPFAFTFALFAAVAIAVPDFEQMSSSLGRVVEISDSIESEWPGAEVGANLSMADGPTGSATLVLNVWLPGEPVDLQGRAVAIARHVLDKQPDLAGAENLVVNAHGGYYMLFFSVNMAARATAARPAP